jgi:hypothetical protein
MKNPSILPRSKKKKMTWRGLLAIIYPKLAAATQYDVDVYATQ